MVKFVFEFGLIFLYPDRLFFFMDLNSFFFFTDPDVGNIYTDCGQIYWIFEFV